MAEAEAPAPAPAPPGAEAPAAALGFAGLRARLGELEARFGRAACAELEAAGAGAAAAALRDALGGRAGRAEAAAAAAWGRLTEGAGWPAPCWRELYVLAQLCRAVEVGEAAVAATETAEPGGGGEDGGGAGEELGEAMRCLDMCSIMGGPAELVQEFAGVVEPLLRARLPPYRLACGALTLPAALPPELVPERRGAPVARVEAMPVREFRKKHFKLDVPVVITGAARDWPALRKWRDLHALAGRYGHRHVPLEVGDYDDAGWREEVMPFGRFVDRHLGPPPPGGKRPPVGYLAQHHLFEQFPELLEDFGVPDYCEAGGGCQKCNAWVGPAGTVTPLHFDSYDNLLTQICGYKYVKLYSQKDSKYLYRSKAPWTQQRTWPGAEEGAPAPPAPATAAGGAAGRLGAQGNISLVDVDAPDHVNDDKFPLFKHATLQECLLGPGDMLYIPNRYWHHVRSLTTSISVNFLF